MTIRVGNVLDLGYIYIFHKQTRKSCGESQNLRKKKDNAAEGIKFFSSF